MFKNLNKSGKMNLNGSQKAKVLCMCGKFQPFNCDKYC